MRKAVMTSILVLALAGSTGSGKPRKHGQAMTEPDARLRDVKTIYVRGTNQVAVNIKEHLAEKTCFTLSNNSKKADAIAEVGENDLSGHGAFGSPDNRVSVSVTITSQDGDELWSYSGRGDSNPFRSAGSSTALRFLGDLNRVACGTGVKR